MCITASHETWPEIREKQVTLSSHSSVKRPDDTWLFHTNSYRRRADRNEYLGRSGAEVIPHNDEIVWYASLNEKNIHDNKSLCLVITNGVGVRRLY